MSYILDALRRADAERELGGVPTLHTQAAPLTSADDGFDSPSAWPWRRTLVALALLAVGVAAWLFIGHDASESKTTLVADTPTAQPVVDAPMPSQPAPPLQPTASAPPVLLPAVEVPAVAPAVSRVTAPALARPHATPAGTSKKVTSSVAAQAASTPPAPAVTAAPQNPVLTLNELPEAIRREQPSLSVGGAMHSANPANRMLILNGQVFHEGDQVAADLVLEQIKLKSAVLAYKGYRYSINY